MEVDSWSPDLMTGGTRGVFGGGGSPVSESEIIDYVNISSTGNPIDFGDLNNTVGFLASASSRTRGIFAGGYNTPVFINTIEFVTIASTGNGQEFGDLTQARSQPCTCSDVHGGLGD